MGFPLACMQATKWLLTRSGMVADPQTIQILVLRGYALPEVSVGLQGFCPAGTFEGVTMPLIAVSWSSIERGFLISVAIIARFPEAKHRNFEIKLNRGGDRGIATINRGGNFGLCIRP